MTTTHKLPLTADVTAKKLAKYLKDHGVKVVGKISEPNEVEDGDFMLVGPKPNLGYHVQVGQGYAMLCREIVIGDHDDYAIKFGKARHDGLEILRDVQKALKLSR